jgi:hypothetical protein
MAKIQEKTIRFTPSPSPDVVTNKLYIEESPTQVTYDSQSFDVGNDVVDGYVTVNVAALAGMQNIDGIFNIGVAAIDDIGNESDMRVASNVPLDFVPPEMVGELIIS